MPKARLALVYVRGAGAQDCPEEAVFMDRVKARLGYDPFDAAAADRLVVNLQRTETALSAQLVLTLDGQAGGQRTLGTTRPTCTDLLEAAALATAVTVDDVVAPAQARHVWPNAAPPAAVPPAPPPPAPPRMAQRASPPIKTTARSPWRIRVLLGGTAHAWQLAAPHAGTHASVEAGWKWLHVAMEGGAAGPSIQGVKQGWLMGGTAGAWGLLCARARWLLGCSRLGAGLLVHRAWELPGAREAFTPWLDAGGRLGLQWDLDRNLLARAFADVTVPMVETRVRAGAETLWQTPRVHAALGMQWGWQW